MNDNKRAEILAKDYALFCELREVIVDVLDVDVGRVVGDAKFMDDFGVDSLDVVEMVIKCESKFKFSFPDEEIEKIVTVTDAFDLIKKHKMSEENKILEYTISNENSDGKKFMAFESVESITCPFCGEKDFDKIGLKNHLIKYCEEYDKTEELY